MKSDAVANAVTAIQAGELQVLNDQLGLVYDAGLAETGGTGGGGTGTFTQSDIDAAVAAAQSIDTQALADAQAAFDTKFAQVQTDLDAMTTKEGLEEKSVKDVQASIDSVQAAFDAIKALFPTLPAPTV